MTKSLDKKAIKNTIRELFKSAVKIQGINDDTIDYLKYVKEDQLSYAYKILTKQIKNRIKLKSVQTKYLGQAKDIYNSLRGK